MTSETTTTRLLKGSEIKATHAWDMHFLCGCSNFEPAGLDNALFRKVARQYFVTHMDAFDVPGHDEVRAVVPDILEAAAQTAQIASTLDTSRFCVWRQYHHHNSDNNNSANNNNNKKRRLRESNWEKAWFEDITDNLGILKQRLESPLRTALRDARKMVAEASGGPDPKEEEDEEKKTPVLFEQKANSNTRPTAIKSSPIPATVIVSSKEGEAAAANRKRKAEGVEEGSLTRQQRPKHFGQQQQRPPDDDSVLSVSGWSLSGSLGGGGDSSLDEFFRSNCSFLFSEPPPPPCAEKALVGGGTKEHQPTKRLSPTPSACRMMVHYGTPDCHRYLTCAEEEEFKSRLDKLGAALGDQDPEEWAKRLCRTLRDDPHNQEAQNLSLYCKTCLKLLYGLADAFEAASDPRGLEEYVIQVFRVRRLKLILRVCFAMDRAQSLYELQVPPVPPAPPPPAMIQATPQSQGRPRIVMHWHSKFHLVHGEYSSNAKTTAQHRCCSLLESSVDEVYCPQCLTFISGYVHGMFRTSKQHPCGAASACQQPASTGKALLNAKHQP